MENIESTIIALKADTDLIRQEGMWPGFRWPPEIKERVQNLHRSGVSLSKLTQETGICIETVRSWTGEQKQKKEVKKPAFRAFEVKKVEAKIQMVNERGIRIEGLKFNDVKELLNSRVF